MIIKNALAVNHLSEDMNMARRDNGTGTVYQRPNGSWVGRIYMGRGADGKPKYKCFSGKSQAEVKRKIKEFNQGGRKTDSTKVSVGDVREDDGNYSFVPVAAIKGTNSRIRGYPVPGACGRLG